MLGEDVVALVEGTLLEDFCVEDDGQAVEQGYVFEGVLQLLIFVFDEQVGYPKYCHEVKFWLVFEAIMAAEHFLENETILLIDPIAQLQVLYFHLNPQGSFPPLSRHPGYHLQKLLLRSLT